MNPPSSTALETAPVNTGEPKAEPGKINGHAQPAPGPVIEIPPAEEAPLKLSSFYFAGLFAMEATAPASAIALVNARDEAARAWQATGWKAEATSERAALAAANAAIAADPFAAALMEIRVLGNKASHAEWTAAEKKAEVAA